MSDNYDTYYKFRSNSQILFYVMLRGRRIRVKFSLLFDGVSFYNTSDALLASKIRETEQYKSGRIIEDEPTPHVKPAEEEPKKPAKEANKAPSWTMSAMKSDQPEANRKAAKKAEAKALAEGTSTRDQKDTEPAEKKSQAQLFELKAEDVDSYMAAKEYLREVVGAEPSQIKNKSLMQSYCKDNGITFQNYDFD